ncbi:glycosyltransferase family 2 protein [Halorarum salinum]|uniref:Glucans biosynthesis glucosyltransferase H n=1 Tax=Halorarum salinum TaxID=2743089 RepID=A0A7D5LB84_9EURY|nr:glycosyltransferase family 2 protein [Halobaculum salinum]QLG62387.1 glycosyltransferase [Halobaculum salinum]
MTSRNPLLRPPAHVAATGGVWTLLVVVEWLLVSPATAVDYAYYALASIAFLPFALLLTNFAYHFAYPGETLPREPIGGERPRVAVLYTTRNDVVPLCVERTAEAVEHPVDLWILSDSDVPEAVATERRFDGWRRYTRGVARGGKSGIINDWLADHGGGYEYFVTLDADTMLAPGNVTRLVEHAEHAGNDDVGIFQLLKEVHPDLATTPFARIVGRGVKWSTRISPPVMKLVYGRNTYWGSAGLIRTEAVRDAGGYDEHLICEDFVLTVKFDRAGWRAVVVDDRSYEGFPLDLHALRARTVRWVRANRQMLPLLAGRGVSVGTRLNCLTPVMFYGVTPVLLSLVLLASVESRVATAAAPSVAFAAGVFAFVFLHRSVAAGREVGDFLATATLETLVVLGMSIRVTVALLFGATVWKPSRKTSREFSWSESVAETLPELGVGLLLAAAVLRNGDDPSVGLLVGLWAASFLSTPFILRYTSASIDGPTPEKRPHDPDAGLHDD